MVEARSPARTTSEGLAAHLDLGKQLDSIETELRVALTIAEDTGAQADSEAWEAFLAYYGILQSMAQRNAEIETELGTVVEFMANGPRKRNNEKSSRPRGMREAIVGDHGGLL